MVHFPKVGVLNSNDSGELLRNDHSVNFIRKEEKKRRNKDHEGFALG